MRFERKFHFFVSAMIFSMTTKGLRNATIRCTKFTLKFIKICIDKPTQVEICRRKVYIDGLNDLN